MKKKNNTFISQNLFFSFQTHISILQKLKMTSRKKGKQFFKDNTEKHSLFDSQEHENGSVVSERNEYDVFGGGAMSHARQSSLSMRSSSVKGKSSASQNHFLTTLNTNEFVNEKASEKDAQSSFSGHQHHKPHASILPNAPQNTSTEISSSFNPCADKSRKCFISKTMVFFSSGRNRVMNENLMDISLLTNSKGGDGAGHDADLDVYSKEFAYHSFQNSSLLTDGSFSNEVDITVINVVSDCRTVVIGAPYLNKKMNFYTGCIVSVATGQLTIEGSTSVNFPNDEEDAGNVFLFLKLSGPHSFVIGQQAKLSSPTRNGPPSLFWIPATGPKIDLTDGVLFNFSKNESLRFVVLDQKSSLVNLIDPTTVSNQSTWKSVVAVPPNWNLTNDFFGVMRHDASGRSTDIFVSQSAQVGDDHVTVQSTDVSGLETAIVPFRTFAQMENEIISVTSVVSVDYVNNSLTIKLFQTLSRAWLQGFPVRIITCQNQHSGVIFPRLTELLNPSSPSGHWFVTAPSSVPFHPPNVDQVSHCNVIRNSYGRSELLKNPFDRYLFSGRAGDGMESLNLGSPIGNQPPLFISLVFVILPNLSVSRSGFGKTLFDVHPVVLVDMNDCQVNQSRQKATVWSNAGPTIGNRLLFLATFHAVCGDNGDFLQYVGHFQEQQIPFDLQSTNLNISLRSAMDGSVIQFAEQDNRPPAPVLPKMQWLIKVRIFN
jgi:hypothetical protein